METAAEGAAAALPAWSPDSVLRRLLWLAPPLCAVHNVEDAIGMRSWAARELPSLLRRAREAIPPDLLMPPIREVLYGVEPPSAADFWWGAGLATLVPLLVYWMAARRSPRSGWTILAVWLQATFLVNVFVPHLAGTLLLARYTPGLITALSINLPLSLLILRAAVREGVVTRRALAIFAAVAVGTLALLAAMLLALGKALRYPGS